MRNDPIVDIKTIKTVLAVMCVAVIGFWACNEKKEKDAQKAAVEVLASKEPVKQDTCMVMRKLDVYDYKRYASCERRWFLCVDKTGKTLVVKAYSPEHSSNDSIPEAVFSAPGDYVVVQNIPGKGLRIVDNLTVNRMERVYVGNQQQR